VEGRSFVIGWPLLQGEDMVLDLELEDVEYDGEENVRNRS
jgi:hypothetical protein